MKNIISGFASSGIFPFNRHIFGDDEFLPTSVTDQPQTGCSNQNDDENYEHVTPLRQINDSEVAKEKCEFADCKSDQGIPELSTKVIVTPVMLQPIPKAAINNTSARGQRKRKSTVILTDTPVIKQIEENINAKTRKNV